MKAELVEWQKKTFEVMRLFAAPDGDAKNPLSGPFRLRPFQEAAIEKLRFLHDNGKQIASAEIYCAGGKTVIAAMMAAMFLKEGKTVIFVSPHRESFSHIVSEFEKVLRHLGLPSDCVYARLDPDMPAFPIEFKVYIVTPYDLVAPNAKGTARLVSDSALQRAALIVLDEVHRMPEDRENDTKIIGQVEPRVRELAMKNGARVLTMTGTHYRTDGKSPFGGRDPDLKITCQDLIKEGCIPNLWGYAVPVETKGLNRIDKSKEAFHLRFNRRYLLRYLRQLADLIVETVKIEAEETACRGRALGRELKPGGHIVLVSKQEEAESLCQLLNERLGWDGFLAYVSRRNYSTTDRDDIQKKLRAGHLLGFVAVNMGGESINVPRLKYIHLVVRTTSDVKLMQALGRIMRLAEAGDDDCAAIKDKAVLIDYQVQRRRILRLAKGIHTVAKLGGRKGELTHFGRVFEPRVELPLPGISLRLEDLGVLMDDTGETRRDAEEKKRQLLALPRGCQRPPTGTPLGDALVRYTSLKSPSYDSVFDRKIHKAQPGWFLDTVEEKKSALRMLPQDAPRPKRGTPLGDALRCYTHPSSKTYDALFAEEMRAARPLWWKSGRMAARKKELIDWLNVRRGEKNLKPPNSRTPLGRAFVRYITSHSKQVDYQLRQELFRNHPGFFHANRVRVEDILALPRWFALQDLRDILPFREWIERVLRFGSQHFRKDLRDRVVERCPILLEHTHGQKNRAEFIQSIVRSERLLLSRQG